MILSEIAWPVYSLGTRCPIKEGSVVFFSKILKNDKVSIEIIDDTDIPGETLAIRRIGLLSNNIKLCKIKYALFFLGDLVKIAKPDQWFIDTKGKLFQYKKVHRAKLIFKKIVSVIEGIGNVFIEIQGHAARYSCLYPPEPEQKYAGLLFFNGVYILYGFYTEQHKTTYRKV
jgi:hypothetical protein